MSTTDLLNPSQIRAKGSKLITAGPKFLLAAVSSALLLFTGSAEAEISRSEPLEIRILLDNSGSMFPGYLPDSGQRRSQLGVRFFREYPEFRSWLNDFVQRQALLGGNNVSLAAFTSGEAFRPGQDVQEVQPPVPLAQFDANAALDRVTGFGRQTFLAESLDEYTEGFEGLLWLITDNIVETGRGTADEGVVRFFQSLRDRSKYRSVHLFKLPFEDPDRDYSSDLAIYGILVSPEEVPDAAHFDGELRNEFRRARRPGTAQQLFPGQEHLKLKDLSVDALELQIPQLEVEIQSLRDLFRELKMPAKIRTKLTQHSVIRGRYTLTVVRDFQADEPERSEFRIQPIKAGSFTAFTGRIEQPIPPIGLHHFQAEISSKGSLSLSPSGFWAWVKVATFGVRSEFRSRARMTFSGIVVRLERERMAGIFGVDAASDVFDFQDIQDIVVKPAVTPVSFVLETGASRGLVLLFVLLVLVLPLVYAAWFLLKPANYRVTVGNNPPTVVGLRRLGRHRIHSPPHHIASLVRNFGGRHQVVPGDEDTELRPASATRPGAYSVSIPGGKSWSLRIEALDSKQREVKGPSQGRVRRPGASPAVAPPSGTEDRPLRGPDRAPKREPKMRRPDRPRPKVRRPGR